MKAIWTIMRREVFAFFVSPVAYAMLVTWTFWCGMMFTLLSFWFAEQGVGMNGAQNSPLTSFFGGTTLFYLPLLALVPLLTMKLIAEERSRGTLETLMTAPVTETSVVLGKYLASLVCWVVLWLPTLSYVWLTSQFGDVDLGTVATSYLGILGIGVYYLAFGTLMSALAKNQIVAAVLTFMALGFLFILGLGQFVMGDAYRELFAYVSIWGHMEAFSRGIVDSRFVVFDLSLAVVAISLAIGSLQARRIEG